MSALDRRVGIDRAPLLACARRLLGDEHEAQDVVQEAVFASDRAHRSERAWLLRVTRNLAIDRLRRNRASSSSPLVESRLDNGPSPWAQSSLAEEASLIRDALGRLPGRQREVVTRRVVDQSSFATIARALNISEGSVKVHFGRGIAALRRAIGKLEDRT
ncbi:MAG: sigma-70 family RNA polymerase sigma factor [Planctomycetes bacterium]|nr:sigma-70 family RNA polymerase sigma factor [Planctomycetota bacterium]